METCIEAEVSSLQRAERSGNVIFWRERALAGIWLTRGNDMQGHAEFSRARGIQAAARLAAGLRRVPGGSARNGKGTKEEIGKLERVVPASRRLTGTHLPSQRHSMVNSARVVGVAQLVERRSVAPNVAGSSPVSHPNFPIFLIGFRFGPARLVRRVGPGG